MERVRVRPKHQQNYQVVPQSELESIKELIDDGSAQRVKQQGERERLKKLSEERVANWPNTIEASRMKKQAERASRLAEEESQRAAADAKEAGFQAQAREDAINRANMMLYEQDDKVKTFNSKMFLTSVLEERHKQLQLKRQRVEIEKARDAEWHETLQQQLAQEKVREEEKTAQRRGVAKQVQKMQQEQLAEVGRRVERKVAQNKAEGEAIRRNAEQAILQELEEERRRKERARTLAKEYEEANMDLDRHRAELARQEELEEQKIARFAHLKEEQMLERKRRQEDKFRRDLEKRQLMISRQAETLQNMQKTAEARIQRDMDELEVQQENREIMDRERKLKLWKDIQDSRARQLTMKQRKKDVLKQEELAFQQQWAETADHLLQDEAQQREHVRGRAAKLQEFQRMQANEKTKRKTTDKGQELIEGELMRTALAEEEEMFQTYVKGIMAKAYHPQAPTLQSKHKSPKSRNAGKM
eukprot:NODE_983_length_1521_cov_88.404591_g972_i0.p1 GENE.NODE_983_length_1521_cov_88.404591_g972_i0~~NODE_983_length_1521_cov_88.404591_g972_i0.p1  ORF type:complete len:474 (-),score=131.73 NODE_983_length_1521_cov_88.404591_g972_i0:7-1428(-)